MYTIFETIDEHILKDIPLPEDLINKALDQTKDKDFTGLAQLNLNAGDLEFNSKKFAKYIQVAEKIGLKEIYFPQNGIAGYFLNDFVKKFPFFIEEQKKWLDGLAKLTQKTTAYIGYIEIINNKPTQKFAVLNNGKVQKITDSVRHCVNQVGAIDSISYEGGTTVFNPDGSIMARAKEFEEQFLVINETENIGKIYASSNINPYDKFSLDYEWDLERTYKTLVQGIKDYFQKCNLKKAVLGLSGGLDSTVCAVLLVDALGKENVYGVSMPSKLTSKESKSDAEKLAQNLDIGFCECTIKPMVETTNLCLENLFSETEKHWKCRYKKSFTQDNIQARSRAMYLWAIANEFESCIPIATSDKSESYMGYATINGDMSGGFAPIADITKTKLFALARWLNKNREAKNSIPESIILKKPGAELAIDPNTGKTLNAEDALMPYEFMDEVIWRIENKNQSYQEILESPFLYETRYSITKEQKKEWLDKFYKRMSTSVYKWSILPPSTITGKYSINKTIYQQPITSSKIDYIGKDEKAIDSILSHI